MTTPSPRRDGAALVLLVLLAGAALLVVREIRGGSSLQDCVMQGRTNCAPLR